MSMFSDDMTSSSSSSSSSVERFCRGLSGGNVRSPSQFTFGQGGGRPLWNYNVMDNNGLAYTNNNHNTTTATPAPRKGGANSSPIKRPNISPKKQAHRSIIDLVSSSPEIEEEEEHHDDSSRSSSSIAPIKKRSLQRNGLNNYLNNNGGGRSLSGYHHCASSSSSSSPPYSPPMRQKRPRSHNNVHHHHHHHYHHHHHHPQQKAPPTSHISLPQRPTNDGATITFGLLSLLDILKNPSNTKCTEGCLDHSMKKLFQPLSSNDYYYTSSGSSITTLGRYHNHQPFHYLQSDNWSCGYRNLQMLLSSMLPTLSILFPNGVPLISEIQSTMEKLWEYGFDSRNAEHHEHGLVGKRSWIGTVEVWSYLSFKRVDSIIVQFIKREENRALLGKFVWAYFNRICGAFGCSYCSSSDDDDDNEDEKWCRLASPVMYASEYAETILRAVEKPYFDMNMQGEGVDSYQRKYQRKCKCSIPPLYLQWDGHSVTVVGVKRLDNGGHGHPPSYTLLIFCPQKKLGSMKVPLARELEQIRHSSISERSRPTSLESTEHFGPRVNSLIELSAKKLLQKDCQILLSTGRIISAEVSNQRKSCVSSIGFLNAKAPEAEI